MSEMGSDNNIDSSTDPSNNDPSPPNDLPTGEESKSDTSHQNTIESDSPVHDISNINIPHHDVVSDVSDNYQSQYHYIPQCDEEANTCSNIPTTANNSHQTMLPLPLFQPLIRNESLKANDMNMPLESIADSIRLINRRDSNRSLFNLARNKHVGSPWLLNNVTTATPMVTSPHLMNFPNLEERRKKQVKTHALNVKRQKREEKENENRKKRALSFERKAIQQCEDGDGHGHASTYVNGSANVNYISDVRIGVQDEDEQWERKRMQKLRRTMEASAAASSNSNSSFASLISTFSKSSTKSGNGRAGSGDDGTEATTATKYSPTNDMLQDLRTEFSKATNPPSVSILYGLVNAVIVCPVIMSFGNIIYHDAFFRPYLPVLVKLTVVSGVMHQLAFSMFSTLPFAVGSVQDAGLIFLSTIASDIVRYCQDRGSSDEETLATVLVGLSLFTATLGVALMLIGKLRLASYVQMLPTPVVGGYLAFIGFFCGQSALCLLSAIQVKGVWEWNKFLDSKAIMLMSPGVLGGVGIYIAVRKLKHMAVLPATIAMLVAGFYATLYCTDLSLEDAKDIGWMSRAESPPVWYHSWDHIKFDKVVWAALPGQMFTVCSMIFVVALSSSLDIAAIDLEITKPLAYNYELTMIGVSNFISGVTGGYTGSYIFSQSIFSLRAGIRSRLAGFVTALVLAITVVMPISILSFVPNFIFASLLIMICVDLMIEWLWEVREKLSNAEYSVALMTFALINALGVAYGIVAGIGYYLLLSILGLNVGKSSKVAGDNAETVDEKSPIQKGQTTYYSTQSASENHDIGLQIN